MRNRHNNDFTSLDSINEKIWKAAQLVTAVDFIYEFGGLGEFTQVAKSALDPGFEVKHETAI